MKPKRETQTESKGGSWQPPRGIRYSWRPSERLPFYLHWREAGKEKAMAFASEADRETEAIKRASFRDHALMRRMSPSAAIEYTDAKTAAGGKDLRSVVADWLRLSSTSSDINTAEAVRRYLDLRLAEDLRKNEGAYGHIKLHLSERFCRAFGAVRLASISADDLRAWLDGLGMAPTTRRDYRKNVNTFFKRAKLEGWVSDNPCARVLPPRVDARDTTTLSVRDVIRLFEANIDRPEVARMALEAFGGLRASSAGRIQREHIDLESHGIAMPGKIHKSSKRKYRQGHPANLWAWLEHAPEDCWKIRPSWYRQLKSTAFARAGVQAVHNGLRHTFASAHIALTGNIPATSYLMQHDRTTTTGIYEGVYKRAHAELYFQIIPDKARLAQLLEACDKLGI